MELQLCWPVALQVLMWLDIRGSVCSQVFARQSTASYQKWFHLIPRWLLCNPQVALISNSTPYCFFVLVEQLGVFGQLGRIFGETKPLFYSIFDYLPHRQFKARVATQQPDCYFSCWGNSTGSYFEFADDPSPNALLTLYLGSLSSFEVQTLSS